MPPGSSERRGKEEEGMRSRLLQRRETEEVRGWEILGVGRGVFRVALSSSGFRASWKLWGC